MSALGYGLQEQATLEALTEEVRKSSEIEGERLDYGEVRSSLARRLGIEIKRLAPPNRHVDGIVEMTLDAVRNYAEPLTAERLFLWHASLFPLGRSGLRSITVGAWRTDSDGPMLVVSGSAGVEKVHFRAPEADRLNDEIAAFLAWFNSPWQHDPVLRAAVAHLWFVTVHPFDDGNGRIARAIADLALAAAENSPQRCYSMSSQIQKEQRSYYAVLEQTQKGSLDITEWLRWFLECLMRAVDSAESVIGEVLRKASFWNSVEKSQLNERQQRVLSKVLDGMEGKLTTARWARMAKCSHDTALRDIQSLISIGVLTQYPTGGRSTSYSLKV
jgi:Fic family protein